MPRCINWPVCDIFDSFAMKRPLSWSLLLSWGGWSHNYNDSLDPCIFMTIGFTDLIMMVSVMEPAISGTVYLIFRSSRDHRWISGALLFSKSCWRRAACTSTRRWVGIDMLLKPEQLIKVLRVTLWITEELTLVLSCWRWSVVSLTIMFYRKGKEISYKKSISHLPVLSKYILWLEIE